MSEFFGLNNLAKTNGVIYLGFGIGSICGSLIASLFGGFYVTFCVIFALLIISLALSTTIRQPQREVFKKRMPDNESKGRSSGLFLITQYCL